MKFAMKKLSLSLSVVVLTILIVSVLGMTLYPARAKAATQGSAQVLTFVDGTTNYCHIVTKDLSHPTNPSITQQCLPGTILQKKIVPLQEALSQNLSYVSLPTSSVTTAEKQAFNNAVSNLLTKVRSSLQSVSTATTVQPLATTCSASVETGVYWWMPDGVNGDDVENNVYYYFNDCRYIHISTTTFMLGSDNSNCSNDPVNCTPNDGAEMDGFAYTGRVYDICLQDYQGQTTSYFPSSNTFVQGYYLVAGDDPVVKTYWNQPSCSSWSNADYYVNIGLSTW